VAALGQPQRPGQCGDKRPGTDIRPDIVHSAATTWPGGTCQSQFVPLPEWGYALFAEPNLNGDTRPGGTCQSVSQRLRVSESPGIGPGQPGHVRVAVARASLGRSGCGRQSVSLPGLRVSHDGSRVAARGRGPSGYGLGALHALCACFCETGHGPVTSSRPRSGGVADSCPFNIWNLGDLRYRRSDLRYLRYRYITILHRYRASENDIRYQDTILYSI
jgi:hypothetical protein